MRKIITVALASAFIAPFTAHAGEWSGTLVDTRCMAMDSSNTGNDHGGGAKKGCAAACANMGIPVAVMVGDQMHVIAAPAAKFANHMGKTIKVFGEEISGAPGVILPKKVEIDGKEMDFGGMM